MLSSLLQRQGIIYDLRSWVLHHADQTSRTTQGGSGPCIPVAHSSRPHQSETVLLLSGACHSVNQWELLLQTFLSNSFWTLRGCLQGAGRPTLLRLEAISGRKPLSHVHSSTGGDLRQALTLICSQPMAITLAGFHPIRCSLFPFSDSHTRWGGHIQSAAITPWPVSPVQSESSSLQIQILRPPIRIILSSVHQSESTSLSSPLIRIILSLQSTNQNHPLSLSSYWPLMWGVWVVKMKGGLSIAVIGPSGALVIAPLLPIPATLPIPTLPVTSTGSTLTVTAGVSVAPRPRRLVSRPRICLLRAVIAGLVRGRIAGRRESIAQAGSRGGIRRLVKG